MSKAERTDEDSQSSSKRSREEAGLVSPHDLLDYDSPAQAAIQTLGMRAPFARFSPMQATDHEMQDLVMGMTLTEKVKRALSLYARGGHPVPNVRTKKAKFVKANVDELVLHFLDRETDPCRIGARKVHTAMAQDTMVIAVNKHGKHQARDALVYELIRLPDEDED